MKRIFAILLTVTVIFAMLPAIPVSAEEEEIWGEITWVYGLNSHPVKDLGSEQIQTDRPRSNPDSYFNIDGAYHSDWIALDVKLNRDWETNNFPQFEDCDVNIDLNGHTWTVTGACSNRYNSKNISITGGTLIFKNSPTCPIYSYGGEISLRNVVFKDCVCGKYGLICLQSDSGGPRATSLFSKENDSIVGKIKDNNDPPRAGALRLDNVRFENCSSTKYASCVYTDCNNVNISFNNCKFCNCSSTYGGAVYFQSDNNTYRFINCEFNNCSATTDGGAIYCESEQSKLCFTNCNAYRCHSDDCGGFIFCSGESTVFNGSGEASTSTINQRSNIIGCYALDSGGAFYSSVNASCSNYSEVRNFNMAYNTAGAATHSFDTVKANNTNSWGGAVCFRGTDMKLCCCDLYSNYSNWYGGAVYCGFRRTSVENCSFSENRCSDSYGNDIYLDSNDQYVTDCTFYSSDNSMAGYSAAKWSNNTVTSLKKGDLFSENEIESGDYRLCTAVDEKFAVDISGGKGAVNKIGANVHLWENGDAEVFNITKDKERGTYIIKSRLTGLVLDVSGASKDNGANIQQWESNGTDAQRWEFTPVENKKGYYYIRCIGGQYMDASGMVGGAKPTNDVNIQSWEFNGGDNQKFKLVRVNEIEEGDYTFYTALDERYSVDIEGGKFAENVWGANVHLWENGAANVFTVTKDKDKGTYSIKSKVTGLMLDVKDGSTANTTNIQQWGDNGSDPQRWVFEPVGKDGYYYIRCAGALYMDAENMINGNKPTNGVNISSYQFTGEDNQKFKLVKVSDSIKTDDTKNKNGDGTKENPYKISTADQWKTFALNVTLGETYEGKYIELVNDIPISYIPVGNYNQGKAFKGHLDGKNHTVHYLDALEDWDRGLFSCCNSATIKNLRVTGEIYGTESLAGICAGADNTTFKNCINDADIISKNSSYVAGISAKTNNCKFTECSNNGRIQTKKDFAGGIAAQCLGNSKLENCRNNGEIYAKGIDAGGIIGIAQNGVTVKKCVNNAHITAEDKAAGGIIGASKQDAEIISCINTVKGKISSNRFSAGILGRVTEKSGTINIKNCANSGQIYVAVSDCGGIAVNKTNDNMTVINCFNATADISKPQTADYSIKEGDYTIRTALNEKIAVDIEGGKTAVNVSGKNAHLWEDGEANVFNITKDDDKGTYIIKSKLTGLVLDVSCASKDNGANIQQWESNGTDAQRWVFEPAENGYFFIRCIGGQYMDASGMVGGAKPTNGVNIQSWEFNGGDNQKFKLVDLSGNAATLTGSSTTGAIASGNSKGTFKNCYYLAGGTDDKHATALSAEDCGNKLKTKMNMYIAENINNEEMADWALWQISAETNLSLPDLENVYAKYITGSGTEAKPFLISNTKGLKEIARNIELGIDYKGKYLRLTDSFAYTGKPIAPQGHPFKGNLDGNGHKITVQFNGQNFTGLFGELDGAVIKNLQLAGYIKGTSSVGGIAGFAHGKTRIDNCRVTASVVGTAENVGGFVGMMDDCTISNCRMDGKVTSGLPASIGVLDSNYTIYTALNESKSIDIEDGIHSVNIEGKWAHLWENGEANVFNITTDPEKGTHIIKSTVTGLVLDVDNSSKENGAKIQQWKSNGTDAQRWVFEPVEKEEGYYYIRCEGGQYMEVKDSATDNGTKIVSSKFTGEKNQKFKLVDLAGERITSIGGFVGGTLTGGKIINCVNSGKITGNKAVGGLIGCVMSGDPMIVNCSSIGSTAEYKKGNGFEHGGLIGYISSEINSVTISNCFAGCTVGVARDSGCIVGNNQKADKVLVDHIYYRKLGEAVNVLGTGKPLKEGTSAPTEAPRIPKTEPFNNYAKDKNIDGIALTSWSKEGLRVIVPKSYVEVSSFVASVFSAKNLPALIIIGAGIVAAAVGVTVMYRKKKKKKI